MRGSSHERKIFVTVADDFGRTRSVNTAVAEAHDNGMLMSASLMAGAEAFDDAVRVLKERTTLSAGIHVTLCDGRAVSDPARIPDLAGSDGSFEKSPVRTWLRCSLPGLRSQIEEEVRAQFERLERAGIHAAHIDGHHHLHMHPVVFGILCREAGARGIGWIRMPGEPASELFGGRVLRRGAMPFLEWAVFGFLCGQYKSGAEGMGVYSARRVYGLSRTGTVDEKYVLRVLGRLRGPVEELFVHPDIATEPGRVEMKALTSRTVREKALSCGITVAGYGALKGSPAAPSPLWEKS